MEAERRILPPAGARLLRSLRVVEMTRMEAGIPELNERNFVMRHFVLHTGHVLDKFVIVAKWSA